MIEPLKHILDIYDKKKDTLLYYLTDDVKDIVEPFDFLDDGHDLFINDNIYCIHKSTLDLDYVGRIMAIQKQSQSNTCLTARQPLMTFSLPQAALCM